MRGARLVVCMLGGREDVNVGGGDYCSDERKCKPKSPKHRKRIEAVRFMDQENV
jgi:hypothetical protein